jgi:hypothetical protein
VAVLGVADGLARQRVIAAQGPAELADDALNALVQMDALADEGGAAAVRAAPTPRRRRTRSNCSICVIWSAGAA